MKVKSSQIQFEVSYMARKRNSVSACMRKLTDAVLEAAEKNIEKGLSVVPDEVAENLRNTSPKRTGDYQSGWTKTTQIINGQKSVIVHNANAPSLTHLLEKGHIIRNKRGSYGRSKPIKHIKPAENKGVKHFIEILSEDLDIDCDEQIVEIK